MAGRDKAGPSLWQTGRERGGRKGKGKSTKEIKSGWSRRHGAFHSASALPVVVSPPGPPYFLQRPMCLLYKARASVLQTEESEKGAELGKAKVFIRGSGATIKGKCTNPARSQKIAFFFKKYKTPLQGEQSPRAPKALPVDFSRSSHPGKQ